MTNMITAPIVVPANYVGVSCGGVNSANSSFIHGTVRSWDFFGSGGTHMTTDLVVKNINPSSGVYNWTVFDKLFTANTDKQVIMVLGQPADYLVSRAATGSAYMGSKANMVPDDLAAWATAVTAIVSRAKNTYGRTGLIWELWNEIDQAASFNDTLSLLGPYTKATVQAIKAVDPTAIILSPSIAGGYTSAATVLANYLNTSDGGTLKCLDYIDGITCHQYVQTASQISAFDNPLQWVLNHKNLLSIVKNATGKSFAVYMGESGVLSADTDGGRKYKLRLLTYAALGCKVFLGYQYDSSNYPISAYEAQWNTAATLLRSGSVISSFTPGVAGIKITINGTEYAF